MRVKKYVNHGIVGWFNTKLQAKNIRMAWQTVIKITNKTLGMKSLDN